MIARDPKPADPHDEARAALRDILEQIDALDRKRLPEDVDACIGRVRCWTVLASTSLPPEKE